MHDSDRTADAALRSWIQSANRADCDFPVQNLPYGVFSSDDDGVRRVGVAIGDRVLDLAVLESRGLIDAGADRPVFRAPALNAFMALGERAWQHVRETLSDLLCNNRDGRLRDDAALRTRVLRPIADVTLHLPFEVTGFTDFYSSREHATNVGSMFRDPENPLLPNWLHMPVAYNARASTVVVDGTPIRRPLGQMKPAGAEAPVFGPCRRLDFELEIGTVLGTTNTMGQPVAVEEAERMIFGFVLLNDWSARDIQSWEHRPLGPFQAKVFATSISPWVVTRAALAPFRVAGPEQQPTPLPYLRQSGPGNYDITLEVGLRPAQAKRPTTLSRSNFRHLYWSSAQQLAHHAIGGCAMRTGDLLGSGTVSGPEETALGSLLELAWNGARPITLETGEQRTFIEDGDTVALTGWAQAEGYRVGFGSCAGTVLPADRLPAG